MDINLSIINSLLHIDLGPMFACSRAALIVLNLPVPSFATIISSFFFPSTDSNFEVISCLFNATTGFSCFGGKKSLNIALD